MPDNGYQVPALCPGIKALILCLFCKLIKIRYVCSNLNNLIVKLEQLIVQHLYQNKSVTLQGIGTLHLNPSVVLPAEGDKDAVLPDNAISFDYDLRAPEDESLINFIVAKTRKIKPLAASDLESYSILAKQFLNIGKPLTIEGIGTILKSQEGKYEFRQGHFIAPKIDDIQKEIKEKPEESISFESEAPAKNNSKTILAVVLGLVFIGLTGLGLYYFIFKAKQPATEAVPAQVLADTVHTDTTIVAKPDSAGTDSTAAVLPAPVVKDSFNFKVVIKDYPDSAAAARAFNKLSSYGHRLVLIKTDSAKYSVAMPFTTSLADTARTRDSLKVFFGGKPYIKL